MIERMLPLAIVVAAASNGTIGCAGKLPWHEPEDMKHFRRLTTGHAVIMGRKTFLSIGRPLPNRRNIVVSRSSADQDQVAGIEWASSVCEAIGLARRTDEEPRVIGGAEIYWSALPWTTTIYMTEVQRQVEGDATFPDVTEFDFTETDRRQSGDLVFKTLSRRMFDRVPTAFHPELDRLMWSLTQPGGRNTVADFLGLAPSDTRLPIALDTCARLLDCIQKGSTSTHDGNDPVLFKAAIMARLTLLRP